MFRSFFLSRRWLAWSVLGTALILYTTWYRVQLDVRINEWFGTFYDLLQKALDKPGSITAAQYWQQVSTFLSIAMIYVTVAVVVDFFIKHYVFRWRPAMNQYYMANWEKLRVVEGAAQRVQEDTMRFASIVQGLGVDLMRSLMTLAAFLPILWTLSDKITGIPILGAIPHSLVWVSLGWRPSARWCSPSSASCCRAWNSRTSAWKRPTARNWSTARTTRAAPRRRWRHSLFQNVRHNYFRLFFHYLYFDVVKWSYLQAACWCRYWPWAPRWSPV